MVQRFDVGTRLSEMAVHNGVCYLAGQVAGDNSQDISGQTRQVLAAIDALLARAGTESKFGQKAPPPGPLQNVDKPHPHHAHHAHHAGKRKKGQH